MQHHHQPAYGIYIGGNQDAGKRRRIGTARPHRDGQGYTLDLTALPGSGHLSVERIAPRLVQSPAPRNQVLHGDCVKLLRQMPEECVDFILTDPPYLVRYRDRQGRTVANDDNADWMLPAYREMYRVLRQDSLAVSFYGWGDVDRFMAAWKSAGFRVVGHLVFAKPYASSRNFLAHTHEQAYLLAKGNPPRPANRLDDVLPWEYTGNKLHPTQKPVKPLASLIQALTSAGDLVLDPFCGSGSSLVAASLANRHYLGIELDAMHHRTATRRLATPTPE